jgi:hypothetical protein
MTPVRAMLGAAAVAAAAAAVIASTTMAANGDALAPVRSGTARYHDLSTAEADGFSDLGLCFDQMGEHWVDTDSLDGDRVPDVFEDGVLDASHPEALVYAHDGERLRLVAVEWVSTAEGTVPGVGDLHFNAALGVHVLHAWVWLDNPDGVFADMNPRVGDCP